MRRILAIVLAVLLVSIPLGLAASGAASRAHSVNWLQHRRDNQRSGFNRYETTITPATIAANPYGFGLKAIAYFPYLRPLATAPVIYRNVMYAVAKRFEDGSDSDGRIINALFAFDAFTGNLKWTTDIGCAHSFSPPAIDVAANVIVLSGSFLCDSQSHGGKLMAIDLTTHAIRWDLGSDSGGSAPAVVGGNAYLSSSGEGGGNLTSVKTATGAYNWTLSDGEYASPSVGNGVVYTGGSQIPISQHYSSPVVGSSLIYATDSLTARSAADGGLIWTRSCPDGLCAFSTSGVLKWSFPAGSGGDRLSVANGVLYMACDTGGICAVNASTGALIWQTPTGEVASLTVAGGIIYWRGPVGPLGLINASTGMPIDVEELGYMEASVRPAPAPVVNNGRVYVVTENRIDIYGLCQAGFPC